MQLSQEEMDSWTTVSTSARLGDVQLMKHQWRVLKGHHEVILSLWSTLWVNKNLNPHLNGRQHNNRFPDAVSPLTHPQCQTRFDCITSSSAGSAAEADFYPKASPEVWLVFTWEICLKGLCAPEEQAWEGESRPVPCWPVMIYVQMVDSVGQKKCTGRKHYQG